MYNYYQKFKNDFLDFFPNYHEYQFFICWSNGYDSNALLALFSELIKEIPDIKLEAYIVNYPHHVYQALDLEFLIKRWKEYNININIIDVNDERDISQDYINPCIHCKNVRRNALKGYLNTTSKKVIVTGHSLSDLAAYFMELLSYKLADEKLFEEYYFRYLENMNKFNKQYIVSNDIIIYRPMCEFDNTEIQDILSLFKIKYQFAWITNHNCLFGNERKRMLMKFFTNLDLKFNYWRLKEQLNNYFNIPKPSEYSSLEYLTYIL